MKELSTTASDSVSNTETDVDRTVKANCGKTRCQCNTAIFSNNGEREYRYWSLHGTYMVEDGTIQLGVVPECVHMISIKSHHGNWGNASVLTTVNSSIVLVATAIN